MLFFQSRLFKFLLILLPSPCSFLHDLATRPCNATIPTERHGVVEPDIVDLDLAAGLVRRVLLEDGLLGGQAG